MQPYYRDKYDWKPNDFPVANREFKRVISLPLHSRLTDDETDYIIAAVREIAEQHSLSVL